MSGGEAEAIVDDLLAGGWGSQPYERTLALASDDPSQLRVLVMHALSRMTTGATFIDAALSYVDEADLRELVSGALDVLSSRPNAELAGNVLSYATLQLPHLLTPHLERCWHLRPNADGYDEPWPWRAAGVEEIARLLALAESTPGTELARRAWRCLLESRRPEVVVKAAEALARSTDTGSAGAWLAQVDLARDGQAVVPLWSAGPWHLRVPSGYFDDEKRPPWVQRSVHPTWSEASVQSMRAVELGGLATESCPMCGGALHGLLSFSQGCPSLGSDRPLRLAACLSCSIWEVGVTYYQHDAEGRPSGLNPRRLTTRPQFPAAGIRAASASLVALPGRWATQSWGHSNGRENLHRVGGEPTWIQGPEYPVCVGCSATMRFLAQLDSYLPTLDGSEWLWGSGGIGYLFWCGRCSISALTAQHT